MTLIGTWIADETDLQALSEYGHVFLKFQAGGELTYAIQEHDKLEIINLQYHIEGSTIITDQPSAPYIEYTLFSLSDCDVLTLEFGGTPYRFKRQK